MAETPHLVPPLSDPFYVALGKVAAYFALLEDQIEFLTWSLIGRDQRLGQVITAQTYFRPLLALLSAVFRHRIADEALCAELDALLERAERVRRRRNQVTHCVWAGGDSMKTITRIRMTVQVEKGLTHDFQQMTAAEIERVALDAGALALQFQQFAMKLPAELVGRVDISVP